MFPFLSHCFPFDKNIKFMNKYAFDKNVQNSLFKLFVKLIKSCYSEIFINAFFNLFFMLN